MCSVCVCTSHVHVFVSEREGVYVLYVCGVCVLALRLVVSVFVCSLCMPRVGNVRLVSQHWLVGCFLWLADEYQD